MFLCLEYSAFQIPIGFGILFKKSTILLMLWRKKYTLNEGGGPLKDDVSTKGGGLEMMTHDDRGEGGSKIAKMEVT